MASVEIASDEKVIPELTWVAVYGENDFLYQFGPAGEENGYGDIDRDRLREFHVIHTPTDKSIFAMALEPDQRLIFRRRISMSGLSGDKQWEVLLVGWQKTVNGENVQALNWVFPDGSIIQTGKFDNQHIIFYDVELLDFEK